MRQAISYLALLAICLTTIQHAEAWHLFGGSDITADFDAINKYLVENVSSDEPDANIDQASKWLDEKRAKGKKGSIMQSLEQFVALKTVASSGKCDQDDIAVLDAVNAGTIKDIMKGSLPIRRVDKVFLHYAKAHSARCIELYPEMLANRKAQLGAGVVETVEKLKKSVRNMMFPREREYNDDDLFREYIRLGEFNPRSFLRENCVADPDARFLEKVEDEVIGIRMVDEDKVRQLFNKYIVEPCKEYYDKVGTGLYPTLEFDLNVSYSKDRDVKNRVNVIGEKIALNICRHFAEDNEFRESKFAKLIALMDSHY